MTPDPASRTARLAGARWWGYLPAHTYLLPRHTLERLLREAGLDPIVDVGLWRTFTVGNWSSGLGERSGRLGSALARLRSTRLGARPADPVAGRRARDGRAPAPPPCPRA